MEDWNELVARTPEVAAEIGENILSMGFINSIGLAVVAVGGVVALAFMLKRALRYVRDSCVGEELENLTICAWAFFGFSISGAVAIFISALYDLFMICYYPKLYLLEYLTNV